jgi:hypothetical protein
VDGVQNGQECDDHVSARVMLLVVTILSGVGGREWRDTPRRTTQRFDDVIARQLQIDMMALTSRQCPLQPRSCPHPNRNISPSGEVTRCSITPNGRHGTPNAYKKDNY